MVDRETEGFNKLIRSRNRVKINGRPVPAHRRHRRSRHRSKTRDVHTYS